MSDQATNPEVVESAGDASYRVTANELRQFVERIERLDAEKKDLAEQQKEVMAEAKARGYDTKVMRKVIALRKRDADDIAEEEAVLEMYKEALGMSVASCRAGVDCPDARNPSCTYSLTPIEGRKIAPGP